MFAGVNKYFKEGESCYKFISIINYRNVFLLNIKYKAIMNQIFEK